MEKPFTIDLHVHTSRYSSCSLIPDRDLPRAAEVAGLSAVVITEHERQWTKRELGKLRGLAPGVLLLRAVELTLPEGDFVVHGLPEVKHLYDIKRADELIGKVRESGGLTVWAHPFRWGEPVEAFAEYVRPDAVEVASCNMNESVRKKAKALASRLKLPTVTASDAHRVAQIGEHRLTLPRPVTDEQDLVACLREMFVKS